MYLQFLRNEINPRLEHLQNTINDQHVKILDPSFTFKLKLFAVGDIEDVKKQIESGIITPNRGSELLGESVDLDNESLNVRYLSRQLQTIDQTF